MELEPAALDDKTLNTLAFKYFKIPKHDKDAQLYFFMTSLLLLATSILLVSSCGCLFYFLIKNVVSVQRRLLRRAAGQSGGDSDDEGVDPNLRNASTAVVRGDRFERFNDEEEEANQ